MLGALRAPFATQGRSYKHSASLEACADSVGAALRREIRHTQHSRSGHPTLT
ncbi:hypothetical protein J3B00_002532 [Pseudomonas sp. BP8]|nr:hypothetical protein [Pseudomonas sp. BP8]